MLLLSTEQFSPEFRVGFASDVAFEAADDRSWTALRWPNGAAAFMFIVLAYLLLLFVVPALRRLWNLPPKLVPPTETSPAGAVSGGAIVRAYSASISASAPWAAWPKAWLTAM